MAAKKKAPSSYANRYPGARKVEGGGDWMEWTEPGQECVGIYKGTEPFRNGFKTTMSTDEGVVVFSTPKLLKAQLSGVEIGDKIAIVFVGEGKDTGKGNPLKDFEVFVLQAEE
jgi:hypothetical protein